MLESRYQALLIKRLRNTFQGCFILKNDSDYLQGVPDLLILWGKHWAILEVKAKRPTRPEDFEPNQEYYLDLLNDMSYAACIYPENEEDIIYELTQAFRP